MTTTLNRSAAAAPVTVRPRRITADRLLFGGLLLGTALLYLIGLSRSGWANQYYAAAAQAGSKSFTAFLFGSLDASNFITVDKPPASLWVMDVSVYLFGTNPWAVLVPQALEGVAAVALLYAAVRRVAGPNAGLLAGAALALTPVATLMFRYDNPDALLVLLMTGAAYACVRAIEQASAQWLALTGVLIGFAFLTKMLQGLLVVPAFAIAYLVAAPTRLRTRVVHLLGAGAALLVSAGWWVALVELWPAGSRPYVGGSTDNSVVQLIFGYNGIGRLDGSSNNGSVGGRGGTGFSSDQTGWTRLFGTEMGTQISWLLPLALGSIGALVWLTWRRPRTDLLRASTLVWGGWLLVTGVVFSFASGIIHPYYTVALAPAVAALSGIGVVQLWRHRESLAARVTLGVLVAATAVWTNALLGRATWHPELRWIVIAAGIVATTLLLLGRVRALVVAPFVALTLLLAPAAYSVQTAATAHTGALPSAGPASTTGFGGGPGQRGGRPGAMRPGGFGGQQAGGFGGQRPGGFGGQRPGGFGTAPGGGMRGGGGLGGASTVDDALVRALRTDASQYEWVAATVSDNETSTLELATGEAVMSLGGYNGTDPAITLARFEKLVAAGRVHYFVDSGQGFIGSTAADTSSAYAIRQWITSTFASTTVGGTTVYDLTTPS